ncbi:ABC transporter permease [Chelatococcus reniformis]|uniref:ABC transmembrane type-1 domain-containing protein n=1 Tax=Chelatococcus reniformis TaxID=1494448 RepID=A0A916UXT8_9HYPH|nr:ABC transporter permease [Chelatococcus reniformis]GGC93086.1 hypothetical protein GCM10010994_58640 [Chelatococcus reniformis]
MTHAPALPPTPGAISRKAAPAAPVVAVTAAAALAGLLAAAFLSQAPNRLVAGAPVGLIAAAGGPGAGLLLALVGALGLSGWRAGRLGAAISAVLATAALLLVPVLAGLAAERLGAGQPPFARTALAAGAWIALVALGLALADALPRLPRLPAAAILVAGLAIGAAAAHAGVFDQLSVVKELLARRQEFWPRVGQHLAIAAGGLLPALAIGLPLGLLARTGGAFAGWIDGALGTIQVVPAIALFALLMTPLTFLAQTVPPLRSLGLAGIGAAPAVIGLALYLLLPVVRAVAAGLDGVDPRVVDAARGMGFRPWRRLLGIELPLALPVILAGVRIASVQAVGLATLAALVGGGGLGAYVFQGMGQFAVDLVLLGVIPIAVLTALADGAFRLLDARLAKGHRR